MTTQQLGRFQIQLPTLTGASDKQIAYGNDCRASRIEAAAALVINRPQFAASPVATQEAFISALQSAASEHKTASYWIDSAATVSREIAVKASKVALGK